MTYQVSRNGQIYGPYTLEDLRRYLASGNILPTDFAKSEDMPTYLPIQQVLNTAPPPPTFPGPASPPAPFPQAAFPQAAYPPASPYLAGSQFPDPPDLHWGLVILITVFTNGIFLIVWEFVVAAWLKKVQPTTKTLSQYILGYSLLVGAFFVLIIGVAVAAASNQLDHPTNFGFVAFFFLAGLTYLAGIVMLFVARFTEKASLEAHFNGPDPVGLQLSGVMTFFFGSLYFQYHLNRINTLKRAARYPNFYRPQ